MRMKLVLATLLTACAFWLADIRLEEDTVESGLVAGIAIGAKKALAQRGPGTVHGTARRTSRRTTRRVARRTSVAGCTPYRAYYNCGGVYYQAVQEGGTTVYVVVNP
ncbi:hypothetical protein J7444_21725 [Labrenzia sp. R4_1]|uniref:hypothetical protein n=1 Tax=Stappiaceae TaxID=2821832 RepID=UPI001ADB3917|nr:MULTISPECIES: hypothetical protein [unclassified Labrenzia]MBO9419205.1 hypothetical protein [Labrenzia sp. R4_2]MBO9427369.1 hypothetical protein [Labrenzia sp. R4_1]